jgi:hypothetical protein
MRSNGSMQSRQCDGGRVVGCSLPGVRNQPPGTEGSRRSPWSRRSRPAPRQRLSSGGTVVRWRASCPLVLRERASASASRRGAFGVTDTINGDDEEVVPGLERVRLLLDTHIALWAIADEPRLPRPAADLIDEPNNEIFVSAGGVWEITIKHTRWLGACQAICLSRGRALPDTNRRQPKLEQGQYLLDLAHMLSAFTPFGLSFSNSSGLTTMLRRATKNTLPNSTGRLAPGKGALNV